MRIRSITYFCNPGWPLDKKQLRLAVGFLQDARQSFEKAGFEVQTTRLSCTPFPQLLEGKVSETTLLAVKLAEAIKDAGIDYAALGPANPDYPKSYAAIPDAIQAARTIFFSGFLTDARSRISLEAVQACARVIVRCARISPDGFANLNFAALANVQLGGPFFPASWHEGENPAFGIATEAADLAVQAFQNTEDITSGQKQLVRSLEENAGRMLPVADLLKYKHSARFNGIDFSLAPFPEASRSIGTALEALGPRQAGWHGSLASAAILTEAIDQADFPHTGFCGLMLPVLEDAILAKRAADGSLTVKDLMMMSAVCGTGLDTVPLSGSVSAEQLLALLIDLAALALRLDKPLTARLMPVPGKKAGDETEFDFPFFANSRVMALDSHPLGKPMRSLERFKLEQRRVK
jgi:uncharacterized protein (UPF0210 family)